jgi:hypothetical protein
MDLLIDLLSFIIVNSSFRKSCCGSCVPMPQEGTYPEPLRISLLSQFKIGLLVLLSQVAINFDKFFNITCTRRGLVGGKIRKDAL